MQHDKFRITHYSFGRITIDGKTYSKDVIIYPDHIHSPWWRKEGHLLQITDITYIISAKVLTLIVGTGYYGTMRVSEEAAEYLKSNNIDAFIEDTPHAVKLYNSISAQKPALAALHLTC